MRPEDLRDSVIISTDPARYVEYVHGAAELGFDIVTFHHVGQEQRWFIDSFAEHVLPRVSR